MAFGVTMYRRPSRKRTLRAWEVFRGVEKGSEGFRRVEKGSSAGMSSRAEGSSGAIGTRMLV